MNYRVLGSTGLRISTLAMGTVELGMDYGIQAPGEFGRPSEAKAIRLLQDAKDAGINLFDTARAYGTSEKILGKAFTDQGNCYIATKVSLPREIEGTRDAIEIKRAVEHSLEQSRRMLQRAVLDIVLVHNATVATFTDGRVIETLRHAQERGQVRFIGASVYGEEAAIAAVKSGTIDVLQIACSVLDQRPMAHVLPAAKKAGVGVMARSILLKGALTPKARYLPSHLSPLREAADHVRKVFKISWEDLPKVAIRYCLGVPEIGVLILGMRSQTELDAALAATKAGPLTDAEMAMVPQLALDEDPLLDPSYWGIP